MDQRLFLAIALSMLVLIGYYVIFPPPKPTTKPKPAATTSAEAPSKAASAPTPQAGQPTAAPPATPAEQASAAMGVESATVPPPAAPTAAPSVPKGQTVAVETPLYVAKINTRGGMLSSFDLKRYKVAKKNINWGDIFPFLRKLPYLHEWLVEPPIDTKAHENMAAKPEIGVHSLGLRFVGADALTQSVQNTVFQPDHDTLDLSKGQAPRTLVLKGNAPGGLTLIKRLTFHPDSYVVDYSVSVINYGAQTRQLHMDDMFGEGPASAHRPNEHYHSHTGPIWRADDKLKTEDPDDVAPTRQVSDFSWLGITTTYFITVVQAKTPIAHGYYQSRQVPYNGKKLWVAGYGVDLPVVKLAPQKMVTSQFRLYMGPKRVSEMKKFGYKLGSSLDLTLDILARPMLALMRWFYSFTGNYGVAIILLTLVVRVLLFPFTYRGMLNIKRMQKLQPRMAALKEKFKGDKERYNKEMMAMYKKYKMNPLGGCLPMALQIPIFFALYSALLGAIELRHEPFIWWITDLSAKDGLYITPLLMGVAMFFQQRMTPTTVDPTQAKIMMWMPVVFTFFMVNFPSGLVVYWLTSNFLSVVQQFIINRIQVPEPAD